MTTYSEDISRCHHCKTPMQFLTGSKWYCTNPDCPLRNKSIRRFKKREKVKQP